MRWLEGFCRPELADIDLLLNESCILYLCFLKVSSVKNVWKNKLFHVDVEICLLINGVTVNDL